MFSVFRDAMRAGGQRWAGGISMKGLCMSRGLNFMWWTRWFLRKTVGKCRGCEKIWEWAFGFCFHDMLSRASCSFADIFIKEMPSSPLDLPQRSFRKLKSECTNDTSRSLLLGCKNAVFMYLWSMEHTNHWSAGNFSLICKNFISRFPYSPNSERGSIWDIYPLFWQFILPLCGENVLCEQWPH